MMQNCQRKIEAAYPLMQSVKKSIAEGESYSEWHEKNLSVGLTEEDFEEFKDFHKVNK
jgi:hypothetical protein